MMHFQACSLARPRVLVIGGLDYTIERLPALDIEFTLIQEPGKLTSAQQRMAAHAETIALSDASLVVERARAHHHTTPFHAVLSFTEFGLYPAALIADDLGIPSNCNVTTNLYSRDKLRMRDLLRAAGVEHVHYRRVESVEDIAEFFASQGGHPIVLKPSMGAGSLGVCAISNTGEIASSFEYAMRVDHGALMVEEWIVGDEYSIEALSHSGRHEIIAITEKITTGRPHFIELGHCQPARLDHELRHVVEATVVKLLDLLHHHTGPSHTEVKIRAGVPVIIETQARQGGGKISTLCELTTGVRLIDETVQELLGREPPVRLASHAAAAVAFVIAPPGVVEQVLIPQPLALASWVHELRVEAAPGDEVRQLRSSLDRIGHVITTADGAATARELAFAAVREIRVITAPVSSLQPQAQTPGK